MLPQDGGRPTEFVDCKLLPQTLALDHQLVLIGLECRGFGAQFVRDRFGPTGGNGFNAVGEPTCDLL
ncbi:hypothetical protein OH491_19070 [Termitidicoccus mucosus]|uniref:Uncharacterized protein n=1 Tax=Termitidicoccus mucosus TaxID=1184151 RepID=A0A178ILG0_9BACT|nr:hypothetical protein AW736_09560 [Opitutaceae bacterium TSB47]